MKTSFLPSLAVAVALLSGSAASGVTVASDPVGFATLSLPANSDSYVSVPFTRPPEFTGGIQSVAGNVITVSGTPGWTANQFVYAGTGQPKHFYALIGPGGSSNPKEGHTYPVTANGSNTITVDTSADNLTGITANTQVVLIPYWTVATVFPATDANISFAPSTSSASLKTLVRVPNDAANGINLPYLADYYFSSNIDGTSSNVGWRKVGDGNTVDHGDDVLLPDSYFVVRNQNGAPTTALTALGSVLLKKLAVPLRTSTTGQQDNPVSLLRPMDVALSMTGLNPTDGSFTANDQLLVYNNAQIGFNKSPSAVYYRDPANGFNWRLVGDNNLLDHGNDVIPLGTGFVVRKAATASGANVFWTNTLPVQAASAVSRKLHGGTPFDINLPLTTGTPGIEPRNLGSGYQVVVNFPAAVTFTGATVTSGTATLGTVSGSGTTQATINITAANTAQFVTLNLANVNDGVNTNDVPVTMGILVGDVNQNGTVNAGDTLVTRNRAGGPVDATTFYSDINADGSVNAGDTLSVRNRSNDTLFPN